MSIYAHDADTVQRILAIEAEIDSIMNQPVTRKWNEQKKTTALAYWREKLAHYSLLQLAEAAEYKQQLAQIEFEKATSVAYYTDKYSLSEVPIQCKAESARPYDPTDDECAREHRRQAERSMENGK